MFLWNERWKRLALLDGSRGLEKCDDKIAEQLILLGGRCVLGNRVLEERRCSERRR